MSDGDMMDDDLAQAYARAHALRDADAGPAASVRASVLAAAAAVAAGQAAAAPPLAPVAAPVADVGSQRGDAPNFSSWRVRSGAALGALLVVGLALWHFDATHHYGGVTVAQADAALEAKAIAEPAPPQAEPRALPPPRELTPPKPSYAPPVVVADAAEPTVVLVPPALPARERDKDIVAQDNAGPAAPTSTLGYHPPSALEAAPAAPARAAVAPPPVVVAAAAPPAAPEQADRRAARTELAKAAARDAPVAADEAPAPAPAPQGSADETAQRVVVAGPRALAESSRSRINITASSIVASKAASAAVASAMGAAPRAPGSSLHAAASAGDVDALRRLLADPATRVDEPDSLGRTPLMLAVSARHVGAVRALLAAGADPDHADDAGATPRSVARIGPNAEIAALLRLPR